MIDVDAKSEGVRLKKKKKKEKVKARKSEAQKSGLIFRGRLNFLCLFSANSELTFFPATVLF